MCIVVGWPFVIVVWSCVLLVGRVYCCWLAVCIVVVFLCVFLMVCRVYFCCLVVCIFVGWPSVIVVV